MINESFTDCQQYRFMVFSYADYLDVESEYDEEILFRLDRSSGTVLRNILNQYLNEVEEDA